MPTLLTRPPRLLTYHFQGIARNAVTLGLTFPEGFGGGGGGVGGGRRCSSCWLLVLLSRGERDRSEQDKGLEEWSGLHRISLKQKTVNTRSHTNKIIKSQSSTT